MGVLTHATLVCDNCNKSILCSGAPVGTAGRMQWYDLPHPWRVYTKHNGEQLVACSPECDTKDRILYYPYPQKGVERTPSHPYVLNTADLIGHLIASTNDVTNNAVTVDDVLNAVAALLRTIGK